MCSAPQNTLILSAKTPMRENYATFLKPIFFWDTLYNTEYFHFSLEFLVLISDFVYLPSLTDCVSRLKYSVETHIWVSLITIPFCAGMGSGQI